MRVLGPFKPARRVVRSGIQAGVGGSASEVVVRTPRRLDLRDGCDLDVGFGAGRYARRCDDTVVSIWRWAVLVVVAGLVWVAGSFVVFKMFAEDFGGTFFIGSTAEVPVRYAIANESGGSPYPTSGAKLVSGVTGVPEFVPAPPSDCIDQEVFALLILHADTGDVLHRQEGDESVCKNHRFLWTGEDLVKLDDGLIFGLFGDSWPDDLYVAPFSVASTDDEPVVVEHGFAEHGFGGWTFERAGGGPVDGVTEFVPATICELDGPSYSVRIIDAASREILASSGWHGREFCSGGRLLWDRDELTVLDEDEPWPEDLHRTLDASGADG